MTELSKSGIMNSKLTRKIVLFTLLSSSFLATTLSKTAAGIAQTALPINSIVFLPSGNGSRVAELTVPDQDTAASAYGGKLRRYDVHVAKMFEVTDFECRSRNSEDNWNRIIWRYYADNRNIKMGAFDISCSQARDVAVAYGLGQAERTKVFYYRVKATINVPILNITGSKVSNWLGFVQKFRPEFGD